MRLNLTFLKILVIKIYVINKLDMYSLNLKSEI